MQAAQERQTVEVGQVAVENQQGKITRRIDQALPGSFRIGEGFQQKPFGHQAILSQHQAEGFVIDNQDSFI